MRSVFIAAMLSVMVVPDLQAAEKDAPKAEKSTPQVVELTVHPAPPTRPAMKYHLLPTFLEQAPGNAAPLYMKACLILVEAKISEPTWDKITKWLEAPLAELPAEEIRKTLEPAETALHQVAMAARRSECDWGLPIREEEHPYAILLPELQQTRSLARLLALRARLAIAEKHLEPALEDLKTGMAMARHVAAAPTLVNGLVGLAISRMMQDQLQTLVQQPGAPNLYWTLTALPDPLVDLHAALDAEGEWVYLEFPEMREARRGTFSEQQWLSVLARTNDRMRQLGGVIGGSNPAEELGLQLLTVAAAAVLAPQAKDDLRERGWKAADVERMSPPEAVLVDAFAAWDDYHDDLFRWFNVPYWQAADGIRQAEQRLFQTGDKDMLARLRLTLPRVFLPALGKFYLTVAQSQRRVADLRSIEALRAYAAEHEGKLPAGLDAIHDLPIPINPVTGKALGYRLEGDRAVLAADGGPVEQQVEYRITVGK